MDSKMSNGTTQTRMSGTVRHSGSSEEYQCGLTGGKCTTWLERIFCHKLSSKVW